MSKKSKISLTIRAATAIISVLGYFHFTFSHQIVISSNTRRYFNLDYPVWPVDAPIMRQCKVSFKDKDMQLCHIHPWTNFGDELGPPIVKRILELHFGCSAEELKVFDLSYYIYNH